MFKTVSRRGETASLIFQDPKRYEPSEKRILIVGGVAGGATWAARARRLCETCEIVVVLMDEVEVLLVQIGKQRHIANAATPTITVKAMIRSVALFLSFPFRHG